MPRPPTRDGEISDELMTTFGRALVIRALIAKLKAELGTLEKLPPVTSSASSSVCSRVIEAALGPVAMLAEKTLMALRMPGRLKAAS